MKEPLKVSATQRDGSWFWFTVDADNAPILWNAEAFRSEEAAGIDAITTHDRWRQAGVKSPYGGTKI